MVVIIFFFFNDTATTEIYTLSLHDALPIFPVEVVDLFSRHVDLGVSLEVASKPRRPGLLRPYSDEIDRKSTRLNSSHANISYAVFCLKKKNSHQTIAR